MFVCLERERESAYVCLCVCSKRARENFLDSHLALFSFDLCADTSTTSVIWPAIFSQVFPPPHLLTGDDWELTLTTHLKGLLDLHVRSGSYDCGIKLTLPRKTSNP